MKLRAKALIGMVVAGGLVSALSALGQPGRQWLHFGIYLIAVLVTSGMKVALPKTDGTMSVDFPFILLGILQLSPLQAVALAVCSVIAQCRIRVIQSFTLIQIVFNMANVTTCTILAWHTYTSLARLHVEVAPALAAAAAVYFFANTIPVALIIASDHELSALQIWRQNHLWYLPFYLVGAMLAAAAYLIGVSAGWLTSLLLVPAVYIIYRAYSAQMAIVRDRENHARETEALHMRTIEGLAMAIEAKDESTHRHLLRVRTYVAELGRMMALEPALQQALLTAAFLHDIGKLAVPEYIINKPGKLTPEEFDKMKIHPVVGADILERVRFPYPVTPIVRSHHEAWDGSGYPDGLKGEEIPIGARILTVVDCFDALASDRPYRRPLPLEAAMKHVQDRAGTQFDPAIVKLLAGCYLELEHKARQQIQEVEPLKTNMAVQRGAAPGAGFEPEHAGASSAETNASELGYVAAAGLEAQAILELSQMLGGSLSIFEVCSMLASRLQPLIPYDCFALYLRDGDALTPRFLHGSCARAFTTTQIAVGEGLSGWVSQSARPIVNGNPTVEPTYLPETDCLRATSSALSIPLHRQDGMNFGVLTLYSAAAAAYSKAHLRILQEIEPRFTSALHNAAPQGAPASGEAEASQLTQRVASR